MPEKKCKHLQESRTVEPKGSICNECEKEHLPWVALRICTTCGHVGCCESSIGKHAEKHFEETGHPVIESLEGDHPWQWCYIHKTYD